MLNRHDSRIQRRIELRHIEEEDCNKQCEDDGWDQVPVEAMLDDGQSACAESEEVEPLPEGRVC